MTETPKNVDELSVIEAEKLRREALPPAARRALEEADARREKAIKDAAALPEGESGGPRNVEPTRYGDWERKGIAYDF